MLFAHDFLQTDCPLYLLHKLSKMRHLEAKVFRQAYQDSTSLSGPQLLPQI